MQSAPKHREPFSGRQELTLGCALFNISGTCTPVILPGGAQTQSSAGLPPGMCVFGRSVTIVWPVRASHDPGSWWVQGRTCFQVGPLRLSLALQQADSDQRWSPYWTWSFVDVSASKAAGERRCLGAKPRASVSW